MKIVLQSYILDEWIHVGYLYLELFALASDFMIFIEGFIRLSAKSLITPVS